MFKRLKIKIFYFLLCFYANSFSIYANECGDVNQSGDINVGDIIVIVNKILTNQTQYDCEKDINGDFSINIKDILELVNHILYKTQLLECRDCSISCLSNSDCSQSENSCEEYVCENNSCTLKGKEDFTACETGNPCDKQAYCIASQCLVVSGCDDQKFCNGQEECIEGVGCIAGTPPEIDDNNPCTFDICSEQNDVIVHLPQDSLCSDGNFCNGEEYCHETQGCLVKNIPNLDDQIPCTNDFCDEENDIVIHETVNAKCSDGIFCNGDEVCDQSLGCIAGTEVSIDDGIQCTHDFCDEEKDMVVNYPLNQNCDDGNFCNGDEVCDTTLGCISGESIQVDDGINCTHDYCDEGLNLVIHTPIDSSCNDGNNCTIDSCTDTGCVYVEKCANNENCDITTGECLYNCEDDPRLGQVTECGLGQCTSTGVFECLEGVITDTCTPFESSEEVCDGIDNDCDGETDEENVCDFDGDGFSVIAGDCDDSNNTTHPNSQEVCDGIDNDCDGEIDEGNVCSCDDGSKAICTFKLDSTSDLCQISLARRSFGSEKLTGLEFDLTTEGDFNFVEVKDASEHSGTAENGATGHVSCVDQGASTKCIVINISSIINSGTVETITDAYLDQSYEVVGNEDIFQIRFSSLGKEGKVCIKNFVGGIMYEKEGTYYPQEVKVQLEQVSGKNIIINEDISCYDGFHNGEEDDIDCGSICSSLCE